VFSTKPNPSNPEYTSFPHVTTGFSHQTHPSLSITFSQLPAFLAERAMYIIEKILEKYYAFLVFIS